MTAELIGELEAHGLSASEAERKAELFRRAMETLSEWTGRRLGSSIRCYTPGRIEILGKHTDYAGGRSLLCAVERGICAVASPRTDNTIRLADAVRGQTCEFELSAEIDPRSEHWPVYPKTVARRVARNFRVPLRGMDAAFASDLPRASGMSSSSALVTCTYLLIEKCNALRERAEYQNNIHSEEERAEYLGCVENGQTFGTLGGDAGVGTFGGSEDHTAILCSRPGMARQYAFCPTRFEDEAPLRAEYSILIGNSGVAADKTGAAREKYNQASGAAAELLRIWNVATGRADSSLFAAVTHGEEAPERVREAVRKRGKGSYSPQMLVERLDQFIAESTEIVPTATLALKADDMTAFGRVVDRSQALAEEKLGNQIPQTIALAHSARELGALAASAFGAGFGGSVWAMSRTEQAGDLLQRWEETYRRRFAAEAEKSSFFISAAGPAAIVF